MNILILGKGGREHALAWKLSLDARVENIWVYPGNPGMKKTQKVSPLHYLDESDFWHFVTTHSFAMAIIGPEDLIANGTGEKLKALNIKVLAPTPMAAKLESSKIFSKSMMKLAEIPTAKSFEVYSLNEAQEMLHEFSDASGVVIKLSGLHSGKGVAVCENMAEAKKVLIEWEKFLADGVLLEEKLLGREVSLFYLCLEDQAIFLGEACDYKRLLDNNQGPNTGGMGCYSPCTWINNEIRKYTLEKVTLPLLRVMKKKETSFSGILFVGLMLTADGPKVLEYNVRFGDPETQTFLPLIENGFLDALLSVAEEDCEKFKLQKITHKILKMLLKQQKAIRKTLSAEKH